MQQQPSHVSWGQAIGLAVLFTGAVAGAFYLGRRSARPRLPGQQPGKTTRQVYGGDYHDPTLLRIGEVMFPREAANG